MLNLLERIKTKLKFLEPYLTIILLALFLRILLMPWFAHDDLFCDYRRAEQMVFANRSFLSVTTVIPHIIESLNLKFFSLFLGSDFFNVAHLELIDQQNINSLIFIFKIPYLIAEIITWVIFIKEFKPSKKIFSLLALNPILIYSSYLFGRYEIFLILFILIIIKALKRNKILKAFIFALLLIPTKVSMLLVFPGFLLLDYKKVKNKKFISLFIVLILALSLIILSPNKIWEKTITIINGNHFNYLLQSKFIIFNQKIYIFPSIYLGLFLILAYLFNKKRKIRNYFRFALFATLAFFSYYMTSFFHPHYFSWFVISFMILLTHIKNKRIGIILFILLNILFFPWLLYWDGFTNIGLLYPIFSNFISLNPQAIIPYDIQKIAYISKHIMTATMFLLSLYLIKNTKENK